MKNIVKLLTLSSLLSFAIINCATAQTFHAHMDMGSMRDNAKKFWDAKLGKEFTPVRKWQCIDGHYFDLGKTDKPTVIYLGFSTCHPCRAGLPIFAKIAADKQYKDYDFVYITFDDAKEIKNELSQLHVSFGKRVKVIHLDDLYLRDNKIVIGYPVVYFLNPQKIVVAVHAFGEEKGDMSSVNYWHDMLNKI